MRIAFLQDTVNQNPGIMYLSAVLKSGGHECELFVESLEDDFISAIASFKPDFIGFGVITGAHHWVLEISRKLKDSLPSVLIMLGGPHPTYFSQILNEKCIDIIARGEVDLALLELVNRIERGENYTDVLGFYIKFNNQIYKNDVAPLIDDLSSLPHPDHSLYTKYPFFKEETEVPFTTTRGCPFRCSFCYNHIKAQLYQGKGKYVRNRNVEDIITEMEKAMRLYPNMRTVILYDDIIGIDKQWLKDFCREYRQRIDLPWFTSIRADFVNDFTVAELSRSNCSWLSIGVESGDEELREKVLGKRISNAQYIKAANLLHEAGIKVRTSNMFFLPEEDIEKAFKTVDINRAMKVDCAWVYTMQPYPGTDIYKYSVENGYLSEEFDFNDIDPLGLVDPILKVKDENKILVLHRLFYYAIHNNLMYHLIKRVLIYIPPNPVFEALYYFSLILSYAGYHQVSIYRAFRVAWSNYWGTKKTENKKVSTD